MKKQIAITTLAVFLVLSFTGFAQAGSRYGYRDDNRSHKSHRSPKPSHKSHRSPKSAHKSHRSHKPTHHRHHHHHHNDALGGVIIGAGALVLGAAIAQGINSTPAPAPSYHAVPPPPAPCVAHWENQRVWVPPVYETRWNPAHYDAAGNWVQARYEKFQTSAGYWKQNRVWVRCSSAY